MTDTTKLREMLRTQDEALAAFRAYDEGDIDDPWDNDPEYQRLSSACAEAETALGTAIAIAIPSLLDAADEVARLRAEAAELRDDLEHERRCAAARAQPGVVPSLASRPAVPAMQASKCKCGGSGRLLDCRGNDDPCPWCPSATQTPSAPPALDAPVPATLMGWARKLVLDRCGICNGRGTFRTDCSLCGDSTYDHECDDEERACLCTSDKALDSILSRIGPPPASLSHATAMAIAEEVRDKMGDGLAMGSDDEYLTDVALSAIVARFVAPSEVERCERAVIDAVMELRDRVAGLPARKGRSAVSAASLRVAMFAAVDALRAARERGGER